MEKYVVLSSVDDQWNIHLGLTGPEGRWWRGSWGAADVRAIVGKSASDTLLESFAEKLAESIVQGELYVDEGERYKVISLWLFTFLQPMRRFSVDTRAYVEETDGRRAQGDEPCRGCGIRHGRLCNSEHSSPIYSITNPIISHLQIALNAQSRQSRLNPSAVPLARTSVPSRPSRMLCLLFWPCIQ